MIVCFVDDEPIAKHETTLDSEEGERGSNQFVIDENGENITQKVFDVNDNPPSTIIGNEGINPSSPSTRTGNESNFDLTQYLINEDMEFIPFSIANEELSTSSAKRDDASKTSIISISPHMRSVDKPKSPQLSLTQHLSLITEPPSKQLPKSNDININISISMFSASRFTATAGDLITRIPYYSETKEYLTDAVSSAIDHIPGKKYLSKTMKLIKTPITRYKNYKHSLSYKQVPGMK